VHNVNAMRHAVSVLTFGTHTVRNVNADSASYALLTKCTGNRTHLPQCRR
jgi:hypothetical protein